MWPAERFLAIVAEDVEALVRNHRLRDSHDGFLVWALTHHLGVAEPLAVKEVVTYTDLDQGGLDALWLDEEKKRICIAQAKTSDPLTSVKSFGPEAAREVSSVLDMLNAPERISDSTIHRAALEYQEAKRKGWGCSLYVIVSGNASPALERAVEDIEARFQNDRRAWRGHHIELVQQTDLNAAFAEKMQAVDVKEVRLPASPRQWHWLEPSKQAAIVDCDAAVVATWVDQHQYGIIAKNLRYPLGETQFNEGILETLQDARERAKFWFYNNGITVVCDKIDSQPSDTSPSLRLVRPQIVNGAQTAFTLWRFMKDNEKTGNGKALENVRVLLRVIQVTAPNGVELHPQRVARYTNSQNPIQLRDLRSNDEVHLLLQRKFAIRDYFYERKRGEWKAVKGQRGPRARAGYKHGKLDNGELAQLSLAFWLGKPQEAKSAAKLVFDDRREGFYRSVFQPDRPELATSEDFLVPYHVAEHGDSWAETWLEEHPLPRENPSALQVIKQDALKHGDLYILALAGEVIADRYGLRFLAGSESPQHQPLRQLADALETSAARRRADERRTPLHRALDDFYGAAHRGLVEFLRLATHQDPGASVRNILVRKSVWADGRFREIFSKDWKAKAGRLFPDL